MKLTKSLLLLPIIMLTGCGKTIPNCADQKSQDEVIFVIKDTMLSTFKRNRNFTKANEEKMNRGTFELVGIRTLQHNVDIKMSYCSATLLIGSPDMPKFKQPVDVKYSIEPNNSSKGYFINVEGFSDIKHLIP